MYCICEAKKANERPPLGLLPADMYKGTYEERLLEINAACNRYIKAQKPIPQNWIEESFLIKKILSNF